VFWLFEKEIAAMSLCFLAVGDPVAGIVGEKWGSKKIWGKSFEGAMACFVSCLVLGICLGNTALSVSFLAALAGSFCAALVEFLPLHLNDNFTIPIAVAGVMAAVG
jgi:glycerol-3-phosphate acyltransferase PlsY